ncbi:hypothetical protein [Spirosoma flavum]|uniref:Uncharacterized protein n=1 Tax=Spirosoma flavum TaxID=2048557 RepID=A0ABW6AU24_9BACT
MIRFSNSELHMDSNVFMYVLSINNLLGIGDFANALLSSKKDVV